MSNRVKLPVFDTVIAAFKYPAVRFLQVVKVGILPTLLVYGPIFLLAWWAFDSLWPEISATLEQIDTNDDMTMESMAASRGLTVLNGFSTLFRLAGLIFTAMITVPLTRAIVSEETPGFLRLDRAVWWYALGQIVFVLVVMGIILGVIGASVGLAAIATNGFESEGGEGAAVAIGLVGFLVLIFLLVRISLFLPEVAMTGRFGFRASYAMTRGNVWRIIGLFLVTIIALLALWTVVCLVLFGVGAVLFGGAIADLASAGIDEDPAIILEWMKETLVSPAGGFMAALLLVFSVYYTGFSIALPAFMYKALQGNRPETS